MSSEIYKGLPWNQNESVVRLVRELTAATRARNLKAVEQLLNQHLDCFNQLYLPELEGHYITLLNETLSKAARTGSTALVEVFLKYGADLNQPRSVDDGEGVVSRLADEDQHHAMIRWLVDQGAAIVHSRDGKQVSRSLIVAAMGGAILNATLFIERGAPVNGRARNGLTALDFAINDGRTEVAAYLRSVGGLRASELTDR